MTLRSDQTPAATPHKTQELSDWDYEVLANAVCLAVGNCGGTCDKVARRLAPTVAPMIETAHEAGHAEGLRAQLTTAESRDLSAVYSYEAGLEDGAQELADAVAATLDDCYMTRTGTIRCATFVGATIGNGTFTADMCCLPCRIHNTMTEKLAPALRATTNPAATPDKTRP